MSLLSENDPEPARRGGPPVWIVALVVLVVSAIVVLHLTGVVGGASDDDSATLPPPTAASSETSSGQDSASVKLQQCLREQGLDVPDAEGHGAYAALSPADRQRLQDALEGPCREFRSGAFSDADEEDQSTEMLDAITGFTTCLRKNGVDVPDPDPSNPFEVLHTLDETDPKIAGAAAACQDELAVLNGGG